MGSTRQIFSEDRPAHNLLHSGSMAAPWLVLEASAGLNIWEIHLIIKSFWSDGIQNKQRRYLDNLYNLEISSSIKLENKSTISDENLDKYLLRAIYFFCNFSWYLYNRNCLLLSFKLNLSSLKFWRVRDFWSLFPLVSSQGDWSEILQLSLVKSILSYSPVKVDTVLFKLFVS